MVCMLGENWLALLRAGEERFMDIAMSVDVLQLRAGSWRCEDAEGCTALLPLCLAPSVCLCVCLFVFPVEFI